MPRRLATSRGVLALIFYFVLRAIFLPSGTIAAANPYGFIAIAALVGLFCDELLGRLFSAARGMREKG